jgi:inosine-uridine nucleoside N-ribohydrolase
VRGLFVGRLSARWRHQVRQDVTMPTKVILDVDTGTDDAVALMTAALSPDIELVGATSVNGNTGVDYTTENTLRVFDWIGMPEIPVFRGMGLPIVGAQPDLGMAAVIHENLLDLPACSRRATLRPEHAVDWLIETYLASDGDIVLCPVGPLTNIAMAIQKEPRMLEAIPEIVIMGGAHQMGNRTHSAEFNFFIDPEAARVVVNCGRPIRMVSLDATHRAMLSIEDAQRLRDLGTPAGDAAARFVLQRIAGYEATQPILDRPGCAPIHDALAVCAIIDPTILTTVFIPVDVEVHAELSVGRTVCDFRTRPSKPANVHFAIDADEPKFVSMLLDILGRTA